MSTLIVEVCEISNVEKHPNADLLDIYTIKGWKIISARKDENGTPIPRYQIGDKIVFIPPDAILPIELSDRLNITKYLTPVKGIGGRVRAIRLRGIPSYGCMFEPDQDWPIGTDVKEFYGITKWEPPIECTDGDAERTNHYFDRYTNIENIMNFPNVLQEGEEVIILEKAHGMNKRIAKCSSSEDGGKFIYMCGSHGVRRREFDLNGNRSKFWFGLNDNTKKLLDHLCQDQNNVIIFAELIGPGIQDMHYGRTSLDFVAYDISINGQFMDSAEKFALFKEFDIPTSPILYQGPFSMKKVEELTSGPTLMCPPEKAGPFKGREGIVITPTKERINKTHRVIFKSISADYLARKNGTDSH